MMVREKLVFGLIVFGLVVLFSSSCFADWGMARIMVKDALTGRPIDGANVKVEDSWPYDSPPTAFPGAPTTYYKVADFITYGGTTMGFRMRFEPSELGNIRDHKKFTISKAGYVTVAKKSGDQWDDHHTLAYEFNEFVVKLYRSPTRLRLPLMR